MDNYEGSRLLDDLKNYLTLKISEHSLLSSAATENSETAGEIPSDETDADLVRTHATWEWEYLNYLAHTQAERLNKDLNQDFQVLKDC